jgi:cytolysin-activating lysine-acyltransferase
MHSRHKQRYALFQLAALVTTPITLDQFRIYRNAKGPVGFVSWAWMSDEASDDYANDRRLLAPEDISSGSNLWVIELIAPFGHMRSIARDLRENVFAGKVGRSMSRSENRPPRVVTWDNRRRTGAT